MLSNECAADVAVLVVGKQEDGFDFGIEGLVYGSNGLLIVQIGGVAYAANDEPGVQLVTEIHCHAAVGQWFNPFVVGEKVAYDF